MAGCDAPQIMVKIERCACAPVLPACPLTLPPPPSFRKFDRAARLETEPGVGWLRLYSRRVASFGDVCSEAQAFVDRVQSDVDTASSVQSP